MSLLPVYGTPPVRITRGRGDHVWDDRRRYLDMTGGIAVNALGHGAPEVAEAVARQSRELVHTSNLFATEPAERLAEQLAQRTYGHQTFLCNSGSEANEAAYKLVRRWAHSEGRDAGTVVAFEGGFHGRTMGSLSLTHKPSAREGMGPMLPQVEHLPWNDAAGLEACFEENDVVGVFCEVVQGEAGVRPMDPSMADAIAHLCRKDGASLVVDEVQTGVGRCGTFWAHEQWDLAPDIVTSAKALGGGMPIGAAMVSDRIAAAMPVGGHGSTFGGNPVSCAAASAVLDTIGREDLVARAGRVGADLLHRLQEAGMDARGRGLLVGVDAPAGALVDAMRGRGVLATKAGEDTVRLAPSLRVAWESIEEAAGAVAQCMPTATATA